MRFYHVVKLNILVDISLHVLIIFLGKLSDLTVNLRVFDILDFPYKFNICIFLHNLILILILAAFLVNNWHLNLLLIHFIILSKWVLFYDHNIHIDIFFLLIIFSMLKLRST